MIKERAGRKSTDRGTINPGKFIFSTWQQPKSVEQRI
jgi:hypothetical protein